MDARLVVPPPSEQRQASAHLLIEPTVVGIANLGQRRAGVDVQRRAKLVEPGQDGVVASIVEEGLPGSADQQRPLQPEFADRAVQFVRRRLGNCQGRVARPAKRVGWARTASASRSLAARVRPTAWSAGASCEASL